VNLKTEMAEGESAAVIGSTRLPAFRVASSYRCNRCEPGGLVEPSTTPSSSLSIPVSRVKELAGRDKKLFGFWPKSCYLMTMAFNRAINHHAIGQLSD
jgi:hypothetical protein